jgi:hypothetical protein
MCGGIDLEWRQLLTVRRGPSGDWGRPYAERGLIFDGFNAAVIWRSR